jgi:subfamily B ATP-binding cassette protein MsbA
MIAVKRKKLDRPIEFDDLKRLWYVLSRYARPHWRGVLALLALGYAITFLGGLTPLIMAPILDVALGKPLDAIIGGEPVTLHNLSLTNISKLILQTLGLERVAQPFTLVLILSGVYLGLTVLQQGLGLLNAYLELRIRTRSWAQLQSDLLEHLLSLPLGFFHRQRGGELISRIEFDTRQATASLYMIVTELLTSPLLIVFYSVLMIRTSSRLAIAALVGVALHYTATRVLQKPLRRNTTLHFTAKALLTADIQETVAGVRVLKAFGAERFKLRHLAELTRDLIRVKLKADTANAAQKPVRNVINGLVEIGIVIVAARELLAGNLTPATFFIYLYVGRSLLQPVTSIGNSLLSAQELLGASERVLELLAVQPDLEDGLSKPDGFHDRIVLDGVSFSYGEGPVLHDISLEIRHGEKVALVGPSGAGKSTLADLVMRFYDPGEGVITLDGQDIRNFKQRGYRRLFGVVPQEDMLFNTTVRDNIFYGRPLGEDDLVGAARIANAYEFIQALPEGFDSLIGDRGVRLSGGQRQRVAIARAVIGKPDILIMDEATSSLDSEAEQAVQAAIDRVVTGRTALIIAHRLSTILSADKIVVLNEGRIEAVGKHHDLLESSPTYQRLYRLQFEHQPVPG